MLSPEEAMPQARDLVPAPRRARAPLRALGLDDRALLHVIALVGHQNAMSRVRLALG